MMGKKSLFSFLMILASFSLVGQENDTLKAYKDKLDSIYIQEVQEKTELTKILHAEPLYIDLIRDLGARKGEREWNVGLGLTDNRLFDEYLALVEYEWAPIDRLGLEVELPFSFYYPTEAGTTSPSSRLNSIKIAGQYSFFVSEKLKTSMALGYIHELEMTSFDRFRSDQLFTGNVYNPFFIVAKRWKQNFHTLIYTGPQYFHHFYDGKIDVNWQINTNFHYMIDGTRNFVGLETNITASKTNTFLTFRPQMRVSVSDNLLIGIVTGINFFRKEERFSTFIRLIYEPKHL